MIFKVFFRVVKREDSMNGDFSMCKVFAVANGQRLAQRIDATISNLKADGYICADVIDCFNISEPTNGQR